MIKYLLYLNTTVADNHSLLYLKFRNFSTANDACLLTIRQHCFKWYFSVFLPVITVYYLVKCWPSDCRSLINDVNKITLLPYTSIFLPFITIIVYYQTASHKLVTFMLRYVVRFMKVYWINSKSRYEWYLIIKYQTDENSFFVLEIHHNMLCSYDIILIHKF